MAYIWCCKDTLTQPLFFLPGTLVLICQLWHLASRISLAFLSKKDQTWSDWTLFLSRCSCWGNELRRNLDEASCKMRLLALPLPPKHQLSDSTLYL